MTAQPKSPEISSTGPDGAETLAMLSLVVPVYNESELIRTFYARAKAALQSLPELRHEIVFIDDGSADTSFELLTEIADSDPAVKVLKLSRNFGHQLAITAGLDAAEGDAIVVIDSDLQDPPEVIQKLVAKWNEGYDVVYAVRSTRAGETWRKRATAKMFYKLLRFLTKTDIPANAGEFRLMSKRAVDHLRTIREHHRFLRGLASWVGFKQTGITYDRDPRSAGETKYSWAAMIGLSIDAVTSFSTVPLRLATWLGYATSILAFLFLATVVVEWWLGLTIQGWTTIMVIVLFMESIQLICLGVIGEYIGRIFTETKGRPLYILDQVYRKAGQAQTVEATGPPIAEMPVPEDTSAP